MCTHVLKEGAKKSYTGEQSDAFPPAPTPAASSLADIFGLKKAGSTAPPLIIPRGAGMYLH